MTLNNICPTIPITGVTNSFGLYLPQRAKLNAKEYEGSISKKEKKEKQLKMNECPFIFI